VIDILFEDNHCLAVNKPAGLLTQGDATGERSLVDEAGAYLKEKHAKPGNVFVGLVHRLDRPTSGVILLARTSKAAARLSQQFRDGEVEKTYWAIVEGTFPEGEGTWTDTLSKDERRNVVSVVAPEIPGGRDAKLAFRVLERWKKTCWLELRPLTGRSHQIRVQLASRGLPVVGDRKYGAVSTLIALDGKPRVALHARGLTFSHPISRAAISLTAPVPPDWPGPGHGRPTGSPKC
jgi:23S rRNA pseudouridine1911/1915/1917 synthase